MIDYSCMNLHINAAHAIEKQGEIKVDSKVGKGAIFTIKTPIVEG